jgi:hypothetical protein
MVIAHPPTSPQLSQCDRARRKRSSFYFSREITPMRDATNVTALLSAPLLAGSQLGPYGSYVALCALVPWLWAVRETSLARTVVLSAAVGISYGCIWAAWIPEALQNLGAPALPAFIGLAMAAAWVKVPLFVFTGVVIHASRTTSPLARIILPSLAFSFGEWAFGSLRAGIPVALLGHSQINALGVAQLAVVGGVPILSGSPRSIAPSHSGSSVQPTAHRHPSPCSRLGWSQCSSGCRSHPCCAPTLSPKSPFHFF